MRRITLLSLVVLQLACLVSSPACAGRFSEYEIKAAYLYNLARFTEWPVEEDTAGEVFIVGILGESPFDQELVGLNGKTVHGRTVRVESYSGVSEACAAQVVFVGRDIVGKFPEALALLHEATVLTVCDEYDRGPSECAIMFFIDDGRIKLEVDLDAVSAAGLTISSKLLSLVRIVHGRSIEGE